MEGEAQPDTRNSSEPSKPSPRWSNSTKTIIKPSWLPRSTPTSPTPLLEEEKNLTVASPPGPTADIPPCPISSTPSRGTAGSESEDSTPCGGERAEKRVNTRGLKKRKNTSNLTPKNLRPKRKTSLDTGAEVEMITPAAENMATNASVGGADPMDGLKSFFKTQIDSLKCDMKSKAVNKYLPTLRTLLSYSKTSIRKLNQPLLKQFLERYANKNTSEEIPVLPPLIRTTTTGGREEVSGVGQ